MTTERRPEPPRSKPRFGWGLPPNDKSPDGFEWKYVYDHLRSQSCVVAKGEISSSWENALSPRDVLLYMTAAYLCAGDEAGARPYWTAASALGTAGLSRGSRVCDVYLSVASVMLQAPRESFMCRYAGTMPPWRERDGVKDNPLTLSVDESVQASPSSEDSPSAASPGEPSNDPSAGAGVGEPTPTASLR